MDMGRSPKSVVVVSILGIIFSAFGILGTPCGIYLTFHPLSANQAAEALAKDQNYITFLLSSGAARFLLSLLLLVCSIGGLKLKRWARTGMNVYAVLYMLLALAGMVVSIVYVLPKTLEAVQTAPGMTPEMARMAGIIGIISGAVGLLFVLGVAVTILVVFNRKVAVDAFNGILPADGTGFPVDDQTTGGVV
jgi:hypothetical protein